MVSDAVANQLWNTGLAGLSIQATSSSASLLLTEIVPLRKSALLLRIRFRDMFSIKSRASIGSVLVGFHCPSADTGQFL